MPTPTPEPSVAENNLTETSAPGPSPPQTQAQAQSPPSSKAIPIPTPKRKASVSTPIPIPTATKSAAPQPTPPPRAAASTEPSPVSAQLPSSAVDSDGRVEENAGADGVAERQNDREVRVDSGPSATEIRPSKRLKTTTDHTAPPTDHATTQPLTPPGTQPNEVEESADIPDVSEPHPVAAKKGQKTLKPRNRRASQHDAGENGHGEERRRRTRTRQKREPTPEGAETIEVAPASMKMSDLCKDLRTGKMSKRETELRNMEAAESERKQRTQQDGGSVEPTPVKQNGDAATPSAADQEGSNADIKSQAGPVMRIVNGEIVLDTASLQVDRHADAARNVGELEDVVENSLTRKINQASYGKRSKTESWDEDMTDLFYRGLRMFGTDFMMISKLFPGRSRRQIKLKFNNEERRHPGRIKETLLGPSETIDIATYSEMTNTVYDDPRAIQQELDEEKKQIEDQHAKEKAAQDELLRNPDGTGDDKDLPGVDKSNGPVTKGKLSRNNKKQTTKGVAGGTEEVVGSIDDFP